MAELELRHQHLVDAELQALCEALKEGGSSLKG